MTKIQTINLIRRRLLEAASHCQAAVLTPHDPTYLDAVDVLINSARNLFNSLEAK